MNYIFVIPSHNRINTLKEKTLTTLENYNIKKKDIYIFVAEECYEEYNTNLNNNYNIIKSVEGVSNNRMFISNYFDNGQKIVTLDDDISAINLLNPKDKCLEEMNAFSFKLLIDHIFNCLIKEKCNLAGIYPVNNHFFMKEGFTKKLTFCIGQFRCFINDKWCELRQFNLLEDYETTIRYFLKYGKVLRFNYVSVKANYLTGKGGMNSNTDRSRTAKEIEVDRFRDRYYQFCNIKNTTKRYEIKFFNNITNTHNKEVVNTLWIGDTLNELSRLAITSWINLGYKVNLWIYDPVHDPLLKNENIELKDANEIHKLNVGDCVKQDILPFSDLWRYKLLYKFGGIWLDADMVLLQRINEDKIIISSEYTMKSGAYKSHRDMVANIGVLKFNKNNEFLKEVIDKIYDSKRKAEFCDNMRLFQKQIRNSGEYDNYVVPPRIYCPIPWWQCREQYYNIDYKIKYDVETPSNDYIINSACGIHLWNNFTYNKHKIDFNKIKTNSIYDSLTRLIFTENKIDFENS